MFSCFTEVCNWFIKPEPLEIPAITNLSLKTFEAPTQQEISSWNIIHS